MRKEKMILLTAIVISSLALGACSNKQPPTEVPKQEQKAKEEKAKQQEDQNTEQKTDEQKIKEYLQEQEDKIKDLTTELDYYKQYVKDITLTLSPEKLQEIIDKEWSYSVAVNSIQFPKNGVLEIGQGDFELMITEKRVPFSVLPEEESLKGKIPTELGKAVSVEAPSDKVSSKTDEDDGNKNTIYSFKGLTPDDVIKITISEELSKKLEMSTTDLEIRVTE